MLLKGAVIGENRSVSDRLLHGKKRKPLELGYAGIKQNLISDSFRLQRRLRDESEASACVVFLSLNVTTVFGHEVVDKAMCM